MHPHTRRKTKKRLGRLTPRKGRVGQAPGGMPPPILAPNDEELSHLADDLAHFNAGRYRNVEPGEVRGEDIERAEAEVSALFKGGNGS